MSESPMGAMTPPKSEELLQFPVTSIDKVLDGDTIDVTIDLGFDLYKKRKSCWCGHARKRTRNLEEKEPRNRRNQLTKEKLDGAGGW